MIDGAQTGETFALVEHPIEPRILAAPMHTHQHEDEYTYVLESEVRVAYPGDFVFKPRRVPHAFWNVGDVPARALEIISPAGFERYFEDWRLYSPRFTKDRPTNGCLVPSWPGTGSRWI